MCNNFAQTKKLAINAAKDFKSYGVKGYDNALIDALKKAETEEEIRTLLRKARAKSES